MSDELIQKVGQTLAAADGSATYSIFMLPYGELLTPADARPLATGVPAGKARQVEAQFAHDPRGAVVVMAESPNVASG